MSDGQQPAGERSLGRWLPDVAEALLDADLAVPLAEGLREPGAIERLSEDQLVRAVAMLRAQGYLRHAGRVADELDARHGAQKPHIGNLVRAELAVLAGEVDVHPAAPAGPYVGERGRILNVVGTSLPGTDSSYTRRTQKFAQRGPSLGLQIAVATQMGVGDSEAYDIEEIGDVRYHRIPGPARGALALDEWLRLFATRLASVVRKARPAVLVASSDFVNGLAASAISETYGIPFIYDVRGLWEDSWLRRQRQRYGWSEEQVPDRWGAPDVWTLRRERELDLIRSADAVVVSSDALHRELVGMGIDAERLHILDDLEADGAVWSRILEQLGVLEEGSSALAELGYSSRDLTELILRSERRQLGNVETFAGWGSVETIRDRGWQHASLEPVKITVPFDWVSACSDHRSQAFHLHAWDFMVPFLQAWATDRDPEVLRWCIERAADWAGTFSGVASHGTMAWYDMAIGLRAPRLAYIVQEAVHEGMASESIDILTRSVIDHQRGIFAPQAFNAHTNHGFYTAVGQLSFATRLSALSGMNVVERQGHDRLRQIVATQFAPDGGHLEHSPDYHRMLVSSFLGAMDDGLLTDPEVTQRVSRAEEVMGWLLRPDRTVVQIGDSPARVAPRSDRAMGAPHTKFLVSQGREGEPNPQELMVLPDAGYAVVRSPQPTGRDDHLSAGYLTLMAGFHSRTHKHCDDLSVTWFDAGQELLIDAGRFGYLDQLPADSPQREEGFFYARPERQYVERTRAHNTVQADGKEQERRHRRPYGSGIVSGEQGDGAFRLVGEVDHGHWSHRRSVKYRPGQWLLVEDVLRSQDGKPHDFQAWWNLPDSLSSPETEGSRVTFSLPDGRLLHVSALRVAELLPPVKGQREPLRGWRSIVDYEFTPAWSLAHKVRSESESSLLTLFSFDEVPQESELA